MAIYNVKQYEYANERQIRIYRNPIIDSEHSVSHLAHKNKHVEEIEDDESMYMESEQLDFDNYKAHMKAYEDEQEMQEARTKKQIEHSLHVSQARSKQAVFEIARANVWEWFITLTFDRKLIDSSDYELLVKKVGKWFNNMKSRKAPDMRYIIVPELHKDGIHFHFHGFLADCEGLEMIPSGIVKDGKEVYNIEDFPYGFTTATKIEDSTKAVSYICKYMTKDLQNRIKGKRRYLASKNCKRAEIFKGYIPPEMLDQFIFDISKDAKHFSQRKVKEAYRTVQYIELSK